MNNQDLDKVLRAAPLPEPAQEFWNELPTNVHRGIERSERGGRVGERASVGNFLMRLRRLAAPVAFAAGCIMIGFFWGVRARHGEVVQAGELAEARACWREAAALFPNQLQAIVFDQQGSRLVLSDKPNQPVSAPIFLKLCDGKNCKRFITFSGQQIKMNEERFEVLIDSQGEVLLIGDAKVWKSSKQTTNLGAYRVFAEPLTHS
jgi:hypothetical protein